MPDIETRGRGRPVKRTLPPRIDAAPEEIARAFFPLITCYDYYKARIQVQGLWPEGPLS